MAGRVNPEGLSVLAGNIASGVQSSIVGNVNRGGEATMMQISDGIPKPPPGFPPMVGPGCYVSYAYVVTCPQECGDPSEAGNPNVGGCGANAQPLTRVPPPRPPRPPRRTMNPRTEGDPNFLSDSFDRPKTPPKPPRKFPPQKNRSLTDPNFLDDTMVSSAPTPTKPTRKSMPLMGVTILQATAPKQ